MFRDRNKVLNREQYFYNLELSLSINHKQINKSYEESSQWLYIKVTNKFTHLFKYENPEQAFEEINKEYLMYLKYESLPEYTEELNFDQIVVSQKTFGHLLHESLGHRHEEDDFDMPVSWGHVPSMNFSVHDIVGTKKMAGHTPIDDNGVRGQDVCLFDPRTGNSNLLSTKTGNSRATNYDKHPLIRQRCLEVITHKEILKPLSSRTLFIDDIYMASYSKGESELLTRQARIKIEDRYFKLPSLRLSFSDGDIMKMKAFGKKKITNPEGGCHKGLQRGLPVSYYTPKAFLLMEHQL